MTLFWMHLRKDIKKMTKIIFATGNEGKMREIRDIMADLDVEQLSAHVLLLPKTYHHILL